MKIFLSLALASALPGAWGQGQLLVQPPVMESSGGVLNVELSLQEAHFSIPGIVEMNARLYNGIMPGPTLMMEAGDTVNVNFHNDLPGGTSLPYLHNKFSAHDETNIHFHGLHVSGELPSDDVIYTVVEQASYPYSTTLPEDHHPGSHWFHPHRHGSSSMQVGNGAALSLIVKDPPGYLPSVVEDARDILFFAQPISSSVLGFVAGSAEDNYYSFSSDAGLSNFYLVNGQYQPKIVIDPGEWVRLRVANAGWLQDDLAMAIEGCEMQLLSKDGIYIPDFPRPVDSAPIPHGGRADLMVRCMDADSTFDITGSFFGPQTLGTIETTDETPVDIDLGSPGDWTPTYPEYLRDLRAEVVDDDCNCDLIVGDINDPTDPDVINGIEFEAEYIAHEYPLGVIQERYIFSTEHPFHQHVYPFQLQTGWVHPVEPNWMLPGDWHDTAIGEGTIKFNPTVHLGKVMIHCHILLHEDRGMMTIERVNDGGSCVCDTDSRFPPTLQYDCFIADGGERRRLAESGGCAHLQCTDFVCTENPDCCEVAWDEYCVALANDLCGPFECDKAANCYKKSKRRAGCECEICETSVCNIMPECCSDSWSRECVDYAEMLCDCDGPGNSCAGRGVEFFERA